MTPAVGTWEAQRGIFGKSWNSNDATPTRQQN